MSIDEKIDELRRLIAVLKKANANTNTLEDELLALEMKKFSND